MAKVTFKGDEAQNIGELPPIGEKAPDFHLVNNALEDLHREHFGNKIKVLNIFVSLDTGVCAASVKKFTQFCKDMDDVVVLNISMDLPFASSRFCDIEKLSNCLALSAFRSSFGKDYGVLITSGPLKGLLSRAVVVLDKENRVIYEELVKEITHEPSYEKVMEVLKK